MNMELMWWNKLYENKLHQTSETYVMLSDNAGYINLWDTWTYKIAIVDTDLAMTVIKETSIQVDCHSWLYQTSFNDSKWNDFFSAIHEIWSNVANRSNPVHVLYVSCNTKQIQEI